jgi:hypothetical protein
VGASVFLRFRAREREAKKERESAKKKSAKKAKVPSAKEKSATSRFFPLPTLKVQFQSLIMLGRGKSKGLE